jgi:threonylcarbamoyladenosine tRNA methylthiotransferase MtaB
MPPVAKAVGRDRAARLRAKGSEKLSQLYSTLTGSVQTLLVEKPAQDGVPGLGRTPSFIPVAFTGGTGDFLRVRITGFTQAHLTGEIL